MRRSAVPWELVRKTRGRRLCAAVLGLVLSLGCAGDFAAIDGGFRHRDHGYTLGIPNGPGPPWARVEGKDLQIGFRRPGPQTISVQSRCGRPLTAPSILARHLLIGVSTRTLREAGRTEIDGRDAWTQTVDVAGGVRLKTVTAVMDDCVVDLILAAPGDADFESAERAFDLWLATVRLEGRSPSEEGG